MQGDLNIISHVPPVQKKKVEKNWSRIFIDPDQAKSFRVQTLGLLRLFSLAPDFFFIIHPARLRLYMGLDF